MRRILKTCGLASLVAALACSPKEQYQLSRIQSFLTTNLPDNVVLQNTDILTSFRADVAKTADEPRPAITAIVVDSQRYSPFEVIEEKTYTSYTFPFFPTASSEGKHALKILGTYQRSNEIVFKEYTFSIDNSSLRR